MTVVVRRNSWHYRLWAFTHKLKYPHTPPSFTYSCLYWPRIILLTIPVCAAMFFGGLVIIILTVAANALTLAAGIGVWRTWIEGPDSFLHFANLHIGKQHVPPAFFMTPILLSGVLWFGWSWYSGPVWSVGVFIYDYGLYAVAAIAAIVGIIVLWHVIPLLKDLLEEKVCTVVIFEDPPKSATSENM